MNSINELTAGFRHRLAALPLVCALALLGGCGGDMGDLEQWVADKKAERVPFRDDLPEINPYEVFTYSSQGKRSPFQPAVQQRAARPTSGPAPDRNRNREILEEFPLDSLRMVGSLTRQNVDSALVQTPDGLIHQVTPGDYMGQNDGRITAITESSIEIKELVPDGLGGYIERAAAVGLSE
ncbi:MAG: pilus assembly protein PilP [Gammaproteobacteria bacterium]|nr:pilus assembly protein PilP [Gammaproteobacteria bacterium]